LVFLELNETTNNSFDIPALECDNWENGVDWWANSGATVPRNLTSLVHLKVVSGYRNETVDVNVPFLLNEITSDGNWTDGGFVALGDNNRRADENLIKHDWIIGKARGELPWFGLIKLSVTGDVPWWNICSGSEQSRCAPENSWTSLVIALVLLIVVPIALDIGIGFYQKWRGKKKEEEEEPEEEAEEETPEEETEKEEPTEEPPEEIAEETVEESS